MNINLAVKTENITKTFLSREVLKDCNIHVEKGTIYGFLGANGAGKSIGNGKFENSSCLYGENK